MKAKNFRIGNLIKHNYFQDKPNRITSIGLRTVKIDNKDFPLINYEQIKPISVFDNKEILSYLGFVWCDGLLAHKINIDKDLVLYISDDSECTSKCVFLTIDIKEYCKVLEIRYVHELQNLFFALTGHELELKQKASD